MSAIFAERDVISSSRGIGRKFFLLREVKKVRRIADDELETHIFAWCHGNGAVAI
jgi:hypothetical protein